MLLSLLSCHAQQQHQQRSAAALTLHQQRSAAALTLLMLLLRLLTLLGLLSSHAPVVSLLMSTCPRISNVAHAPVLYSKSQTALEYVQYYPIAPG